MLQVLTKGGESCWMPLTRMLLLTITDSSLSSALFSLKISRGDRRPNIFFQVKLCESKFCFGVILLGLLFFLKCCGAKNIIHRFLIIMPFGTFNSFITKPILLFLIFLEIKTFVFALGIDQCEFQLQKCRT